jgi:hypothetical protein
VWRPIPAFGREAERPVVIDRVRYLLEVRSVWKSRISDHDSRHG